MNLKELRNSKGFSQEFAAKLVKVPLRTYKRYETVSSYKNTLKYNSIFEQISKAQKRQTKTKINTVKNILIIGGGFVGLNTAKLLSKKCSVEVLDIDQEVVSNINKTESKIKGVNTLAEARKFNIAIICLPTNFDETKGSYDTKNIESTIKAINKINSNALIAIKSTVSVGYTTKLNSKYKNEIIFVPEFLREKSALEDSLRPNRLIIGCGKLTPKVKSFADIIEDCIDVPRKTIFMSRSEAEATKLYSNAYLAMRLSFFNELDSYCMDNNLDTKTIIKAMGLDPRIGLDYNNPSLFYSGYCLPKDTKALASQTKSNLVKSVIKSNDKRKIKIVEEIIKEATSRSAKPVIGIYNLETKRIGKTYRASASLELYELLKKYPVKVVVFDKNHADSMDNFEDFVMKSDLIVTSKQDEILKPFESKIFTRSIN